MQLKLLITREQIQHSISSAVEKLYYKIHSEPCTFLVVLDGAFMFASDFLRTLDDYYKKNDILHENWVTRFIKLRSYEGTESTGEVTVVYLPNDLSGKVVILEDIVDTGLTMTYLYNLLRKQGIDEIITVTFLDKPSRRIVSFEPDIACITLVGSPFVIGYGLDYNGQFRELPEVYEVIL